MKKKGWKKPKVQTLICGYCKECNKELMSNNGGWIDDQFKKVEDVFTFDFTNFSKRKKKKK